MSRSLDDRRWGQRNNELVVNRETVELARAQAPQWVSDEKFAHIRRLAIVAKNALSQYFKPMRPARTSGSGRVLAKDTLLALIGMQLANFGRPPMARSHPKQLIICFLSAFIDVTQSLKQIILLVKYAHIIRARWVQIHCEGDQASDQRTLIGKFFDQAVLSFANSNAHPNLFD